MSFYYCPYVPQLGNLTVEELAQAIINLINSKPYSPRKEELMVLLADSKWSSTEKKSVEDIPKDGRPIFIICKDGMSYPAYYGLAKDEDGNLTVEQGDADEDFPWAILDPSGESAAIDNNEIDYWMELPK